MINQGISTRTIKETGVLVAITQSGQPSEKATEYLEELEFLASTLGIDSKKQFTQKIDKPDPRTFVGKGKAEEIRSYVRAHDIDLVIFDDDLSPSQLRNLEQMFKCRIYDRSLLILEIFLKRAKTAQAKTQVELARYQYLMPRLTRMWTHLERQRGGTGTRGGAGEKEIETDRRIIRDQIAVLKGKLEKIDRQSHTQRKGRSNIVRVSLVGYTNVGKSTLMNLLTRSKVLAEDKLFATVDSTVRKVVINNVPFLLSDTVGFIRKLPHHLIESFKSTLDEVAESDILIHVVDISHPSFHDHIEVVNNTLMEIGAHDKPVVYAYNKIDQLEDADDFISPAGEFLSSRFQVMLGNGGANRNTVYISARNNINVDELKNRLFEKVRERHFTIYPNYLQHQY
jgi:GTP-binding protein HflX